LTTDTIIALATPPGPSAIALLRMSGPQAHAAASQFIKAKLPVRKAVHADFIADGALLDDVVVTAWEKPASYTGEDLIEISCHGNMLIVEKIIAACCAAGARLSQPGEFTQRAFENGKMDLTQAEAVMDVIQAQSERSLAAAHRLRGGALAVQTGSARETLLNNLAHLEAYIDFPDEDIKPEVQDTFRKTVSDLIAGTDRLLATAREGKRLREGLTVVLAGAPNAGKSSLLNRLLNADRAIVSPLPGTTRDTIEAAILLEGIRIRLIDTAGLREGGDEIEQLGMARTRDAVAQADLILQIEDGLAPHGLDVPHATATPVLHVRTRSDLAGFLPGAGLSLSSVTGDGLDRLKQEIVRVLQLDASLAGQEEVAINTRHETALTRARENLERALQQAAAGAPPELVSADLRQALDAYGEIIGHVTNEDMLDRLFKTFCIGK
jgi:tRNA modification GTPase